MLTWIAVMIVFSILILVHEAGHLVAAKRAGITVEIFSLGMGKRIAGWKAGETEYRISLIPFGGYCKMAGEEPGEASGREDEFSSKSVGARFWVVSAGAITNYVFAFLLFCVIFMAGAPVLSNRVGKVLKGYPAEEYGIREGDRILAIDGREVNYWEDIVELVRARSRRGEALDISIERDDQVLVKQVQPEISSVRNVFGQTISRPMIGIAPQQEVLSVSYGPLEAVQKGGKRLLTLTAMTYKGIWLLVTGGMPVTRSVSGPIGIAYMIEQAAGVGFVPLLIITAHISMALAIFNLLPFPVLDGGHVVFLAYEKIAGRPVSQKVREVATQIALILLIAFAVFVSWQDILKFTPLGK